MKKNMKYIALLLMGAILAGCGISKEIKKIAQSERMDVFRELKPGEEIPQGFAGLSIKATLKTHVEGYYLFEFGETYHGKSEYPFLVKVDGQAILWKAQGHKEDTPLYDKKGNFDPERGEGVKYILEKRIMLTLGPHKVIFAMPPANYFQEMVLTLRENRLHTLEFKPVYKKGRHYSIFLKGIKEFEVYLDGKAP